MKSVSLILLLVCSLNVFAQGPYAPDASTLGTSAIHKDSSIITSWASGCVIERGWMDIANTTLGKASVGTNASATGMSGANGVVSLGDNGYAILTFSSPITNGTGCDFAVFENGFNNTFLELAHVEVSSDGVNFFRFESVSLSPISVQINNVVETTNIHNLAGKYRAQFGTPFDLEELVGIPGLDVNNITHVKIVDVIGSINPAYATYDSQGNIINDPYPTPFISGGFDLDAVGVIQSPVGILETLTDFKVFPNPANEKVTLQFENQSTKLIEITSINGSVVKQITTSSNQIELNISDYNKGIYFIKIIVKNEVRIKKLIVN